MILGKVDREFCENLLDWPPKNYFRSGVELLLLGGGLWGLGWKNSLDRIQRRFHKSVGRLGGGRMRFTIRCEGPGIDESKDSVPSVARYWVIHERFPVSISIL